MVGVAAALHALKLSSLRPIWQRRKLGLLARRGLVALQADLRQAKAEIALFLRVQSKSLVMVAAQAPLAQPAQALLVVAEQD